jgi:hypothetical protein
VQCWWIRTKSSTEAEKLKKGHSEYIYQTEIEKMKVCYFFQRELPDHKIKVRQKSENNLFWNEKKDLPITVDLTVRNLFFLIHMRGFNAENTVRRVGCE